MTKEEYEAIAANEAAREREFGMLNCYACPRRHYTFTIDRDHGVTPFIIRCEHREPLAKASAGGQSVQCKEQAQSSMYRVHENWSSKVTHEFYRPSFEYFQARITDPRMVDHIKGGGLCFRKVGDLDCYGADAIGKEASA